MLGQEATLVPRTEAKQNDLGNVNIVRTLRAGDKEYILRAHPKGLQNGYFWAESVVSAALKKAGLPAYGTVKVQDIDATHPFAFMIIEKLTGMAVKDYLETSPNQELALTHAAGTMMARMHKLTADGFGFLDNTAAKSGTIVGIKKTFREHVLAGLESNLIFLQEKGLLQTNEAEKARQLFMDTPLVNIDRGVFVHNDFADWNLLGQDSEITGILDLDECYIGDPIADLACWTTFHGLERYKIFLEGYESIAELPIDYNERFWIYRLRYLISKLTLRTRRLSWDFGPLRPMLEQKLATGRADLEQCFKELGF